MLSVVRPKLRDTRLQLLACVCACGRIVGDIRCVRIFARERLKCVDCRSIMYKLGWDEDWLNGI